MMTFNKVIGAIQIGLKHTTAMGTVDGLQLLR
jgi:hypothetical protein